MFARSVICFKWTFILVLDWSIGLLTSIQYLPNHERISQVRTLHDRRHPLQFLLVLLVDQLHLAQHALDASQVIKCCRITYYHWSPLSHSTRKPRCPFLLLFRVTQTPSSYIALVDVGNQPTEVIGCDSRKSQIKLTQSWHLCDYINRRTYCMSNSLCAVSIIVHVKHESFEVRGYVLQFVRIPRTNANIEKIESWVCVREQFSIRMEFSERGQRCHLHRELNAIGYLSYQPRAFELN